ncbi:MAG: glycosyl transferase family 1, partial [bacterium]
NTTRFHNFLSIDRRWLDEQGSEDCHGRAIWALGTAVGRSPHWSSQMMAERLFAQALPAVTDFTSPRAWAFSLIGIHEYLHNRTGHCLANNIREELTARLITILDKVAEPGWTWFEEELTYDNAKLAHALIVSGRATGQGRVYERGIEALRWLVGVQTSQNGQLRPIGSNGFYKRNGVRADFDQQPIEAQATVSACLEAYCVTADPWWYEQAQRAFDWFLGWNDLGLELYARRTGGCRDGLHADRSNENQGAESMLAFLLSLAEMRMMQNTATLVQRAATAAAITQ